MGKSASDRPTARTYSGGATLPALTDTFQDVRVGRDADGELVPEQRAFIVTVRNRSRWPMFVKEGDGDEVKIAAGEAYQITRVNGTSRIRLKGVDVGTDYEIRTIEAHNDFGVLDKVEAFAQSVGALLRSSEVSVGRQTSEGLVEANADQTADVAANTAQSTILRADPGEVWELRHMELRADNMTGASGEHLFKIETEEQEIELLQGGNDAGADITYESGKFTTASFGRGSFESARVGEDGGIQITYENGGDQTQTNTRTIRLAFRVIQA